jgi:hypothetical protein
MTDPLSAPEKHDLIKKFHLKTKDLWKIFLSSLKKPYSEPF